MVNVGVATDVRTESESAANSQDTVTPVPAVLQVSCILSPADTVLGPTMLALGAGERKGGGGGGRGGNSIAIWYMILIC